MEMSQSYIPHPRRELVVSGGFNDLLKVWSSDNSRLLQFAASILFSGNNFAKVKKLAKLLGLSFLSDSTFYRMQRLYLIPCVNEWRSWQREQLIQEFRGKEIVVCGDGQCDSPGHTAKNLCYFLMELVSGYIVEIEVCDKHHVGLASTNMEKQALQNALQRLRFSLNVMEVVTDTSPSIKKLISKLVLYGEKYVVCDICSIPTHSLHIHRVVKLYK